jgi:hypothetical protein
MRCPGPVLADMDGDGQLDVFVETQEPGTDNGRIYKLAGNDGAVDFNHYTLLDGLQYETQCWGELSVCDDHQIGYPDLFGTLLYFDGTNDHLRSQRWDHVLAAGGTPFPYDQEAGHFDNTDRYSPAMTPSQVGTGFTMDVVAADSLIFQRTDV